MLKASNGNYSDYRSLIAHKTIASNHLLSALLELTPVCNLNCRMCYVRRTNEEVIASGNHVMRFGEWKYYIDGLCDMGPLSITLSGGECTAHPDFEEIYRYIYDKNVEISVITNGSCLNDRIFELFKNKPPTKIYLTMYGMSEETYENFCGNGAAFQKVMKNIDILLDINMPLMLQYTSGEGNIHDFEKASDYAISKGCQFYFTGELMNYGLCDADKLKSAEPDEELFKEAVKNISMKKFHMSSEEYDRQLNELRVPDLSRPVKEKGITCNAGRNSCAVSWQGKMKPCVALDVAMLDPRENGGIKACWEKINEWAYEVPSLAECQKCIFRNKCKICYALHYGDTKEYGKVSPRLCYKLKHPEEAARLLEEYEKNNKTK